MPRRALLTLATMAVLACDRTNSPLEPLPPLPVVPTATSTLQAVSSSWVTSYDYLDLGSPAGFQQPRSGASGLNGLGWAAGATTGYFTGLFVETTRATLWTPAGPQDLGVLPPGHSSQSAWAWDVNDAGVVAGYGRAAAANGQCCGEIRAFTWTSAAGFTVLPGLPGAETARSMGYAINTAGDVAGFAQSVDGSQHAMLWPAGGSPLDLGTAGKSGAVANAINDAGQAAGSASDGAAMHAFLWSPSSGFTMLGHLGGGSADARGVNNLGHVVGISTVADGSEHPFRWTPNAGMEDLGLPEGAFWALARGINDLGHVSVQAAFIDPDTGEYSERAFVWVEGTWIDLGLNLGMSGPGDINNHGQVAGYAISPATGYNGAALWSYRVTPDVPAWPFTGFFAPIDNLPAVNRVKAGSAIPVKFSLGGDRGLDIFAAGYPASAPVACELGAPVAAVEETVTAGASSLSYDPAAGQYVYVWKTAKAWAGSCRKLTVRLTDGGEKEAVFQFTR